MDLNALRNFISKLSFIYERSRNSNGYNVEISVQNVDNKDVGIKEQVITGYVVLITAQGNKRIEFTSLLKQTNELLKFESSYRFGNVKNNQDKLSPDNIEYEENGVEDMFLLIDDIEKTHMFDPIFAPGNKLLIHKEGDAISHVYRVGKNYSFNNGISDSFTLLNMNDTVVAEQVNRISKRV